MKERSERFHDVVSAVIYLLEFGLPVIWLGFDQTWARTLWVAFTLISTLIMLLMFSIRALAMNARQLSAKERADWAMPKPHKGKMVFRTFVTLGFAYLMVEYAHHPFIAALMVLMLLIITYEMFTGPKLAK